MPNPRMDPKRTKKPFRAALNIVLGLVAIACLVVFVQSWNPSIGEVQIQYENGETLRGPHPLFVKSNGTMMDVEIPVELSAIHPRIFHIKPDDCIVDFFINNQRVDPKIAKFCDYSSLGPSLNLAKYLQPGENLFRFRIKDDGGLGGVRITAARTDMIFLSILILFTGTILFWFGEALLYLLPRMFRVTGTLQWIVLLGIGLRILYFLATPYDVRGQDTGSHIEYIEHVAETLSIPNAADGWEFHQAPLYYFLSGRWYRFASEAFAPSKESLLYQIQLGSLIVSIATFLIAIWLGSVLFAAINERRHRNLFALSIAIFPALIFVGARITNNGLYNLLLFLALGLLVRYYKSGSLEDWYSAVLMLSVTIITRISGLLMLPVALACFVLQKNTPKKRLHFMSALLIGAILTGWYPYVRLFVEDDARNTISIGNQNMNGALRVDNTIVNFTTFNPIEILKVPFNDPWKDEARRMYFWEYFFKSALYGEIRFAEELKGIAIFMNLLALILTLAIIRGIVIAFRRRPPELVPMGLTLAFAMTAHFWYRITKAFAANQDFRFSIILIIPLTYFLVIGITSLPERPSKFFELTLKQFAFLTTGFFLLLFLL